MLHHVQSRKPEGITFPANGNPFPFLEHFNRLPQIVKTVVLSWCVVIDPDLISSYESVQKFKGVVFEKVPNTGLKDQSLTFSTDR